MSPLVVTQVGWLILGALVLYAKSRGWTTRWQRKHPVVSIIVLVLVIWAAAGALVFLGVLGLIGGMLVAPSVPWVLRRA